ncbi:MAG: MobV family relaxase, partial [Sulfurimonas sp.]
YTKAQAGHLGEHYERHQKENGEYVKFANETIDTSRTNLNYNLASDLDKTHLEKIDEIVTGNNYKLQNRKDVNVMCSCVITLPKELLKESSEFQRSFFEKSYDFLGDRYGKENVISAFVHNDETTPHLHFAFVPVVKDKKKDIYKVSAKELLNKQELKIFHTDLKKYLDREFGRDIKILNNATKEGNKSILELKSVSEYVEEQKIDLKAIFEPNQFKEHNRNKQLDYYATNDVAKEELKKLEKESNMSFNELIKKSTVVEKTFFTTTEKIDIGLLEKNYNSVISKKNEVSKMKDRMIEAYKNFNLSKNELLGNVKDFFKEMIEKQKEHKKQKAFEKVKEQRELREQNKDKDREFER